MAIQFRLFGNPATVDDLPPVTADNRYLIPVGINVLNYGAKGDSFADDSAAIARADTAAQLVKRALFFPLGTYKIGTNLTITSPIILTPGASFSIPSTTLTLNGSIQTQIQQIFSCTGSGSVSFGDGVIEEGYAEWWGAKVNDGTKGAINLAAITAALTALPTTQLFAGDYFISSGLSINNHHRTLKGHASYYRDDTSPATRIVLQSSGGAVLTITPASDPGTNISLFTRSVKVSDIDLTRNQTPAPAASGSELSGPIGLLLTKTLSAVIERVVTTEHSVGICENGTVRTKVGLCRSSRSLTGQGSNLTNDKFWGYWFNGAAAIGLAGGNASSMWNDSVAVVEGTPALVESVGYLLTDSYVDTFLFRPETAACTKGIWLQGTAGTSAHKTGDADVHIIQPICDGFTDRGIYIVDHANYGSITIDSPYCAPASGASTVAAIQVDSSDGAVTITGGGLSCWPTSSTIGVFVNAARAVDVLGVQIIGSARPVLMRGAELCRIEPIIQSPEETPTEAAVLLDNAGTPNSRNRIMPTIVAPSTGGTFPIGVNLAGSANDHNEINCSLIDPAALTSGSINKLVINGVQVTATGLSGTNLASGVMD